MTLPVGSVTDVPTVLDLSPALAGSDAGAPVGTPVTDAVVDRLGEFHRQHPGLDLEIIADSEARLSKAIRTQDLQTDGPKVADSLRKHAQALRAQARAAGEGAEDGFAIAPYSARPVAPELANFPRRGPGWLV